MRVLFDINHPAHVHFFRHSIRLLKDRGAEVLITSRHKECTVSLLDAFGIEHTTLSSLNKRGGLIGLGVELLQRDVALWRAARRFRPTCMAAIGGTFIAHVGLLTGIPSLVFYDTENARLQNAITYPLATKVIVPRCYHGWVPKGRELRYPGYHELAYLHPCYFEPDFQVASANGVRPGCDNFLVRTVSWQANHDVGEKGWTPDTLRKVIEWLAPRGNVMVSAEGSLPADLEPFRYQGSADALHHVMAHCRSVIGESATMASEAAVLGVPAVYAAHTDRGYTNEQELKYGLVRNVRDTTAENILAAIGDILDRPEEHWKQAHRKLLDNTVDVTQFIVGTIETTALDAAPKKSA